MSKYLHIFSDAPYTHKFIKFIKEYFDEKEHFFIILCNNDKSKFIDFYKSQENCIVTQSKNIYFNNKEKFKQAKKVLVHQLNKPVMMASLSVFYPSVFKKMVWVIWGGDVYFYKYKSDTLKDSMLELLRKYTIKKIPTIVSYIKGDYDKVVEVYNTKAKYLQAWYPSPIDIDMISKLPIEEKKSKTMQIVVGNSADPSNEHINTFKLLEKFSKKDIEIYTVLSYGGSKSYIESVLSEGNRMFGDKFKPIMEYMSFDDFLAFINESDICILNHKRQQGLGNQLVFFILKKKVYISETTTPFEYYKENGIDIYSTESIENMNFEEFCFQGDEMKNENRRLTIDEKSEKIIAILWQNVFQIS